MFGKKSKVRISYIGEGVVIVSKKSFFKGEDFLTIEFTGHGDFPASHFILARKENPRQEIHALTLDYLVSGFVSSLAKLNLVGEIESEGYEAIGEQILQQVFAGNIERMQCPDWRAAELSEKINRIYVELEKKYDS